MSDEYKYLIPEESNGVITENVVELRRIEEKLRKTFNRYNMVEILIPSFEYVDIYKSVYANFDEEKIFKYIGNDGKVIALRWDFTIAIARHYFSQNTNNEARYSYFGKVYRKEKIYKGRNSEKYQAGIEIINNPGTEGNIECLNLLQDTLKEIKLSNLKLELGSAKLFDRICHLVGDKTKLVKILSKKNISEMEEFVENNKMINNNLKKFLVKLPRLCGGIEMIDDYINIIQDEIIVKSLKELKMTYDSLNNKENIIFDLSMCPSMEYYTCLMFKVYSQYCPEPIISGGRYDSLYKNFKHDASAIGMGYYLNNIIKAIEKEGEKIGQNSNNKRAH